MKALCYVMLCFVMLCYVRNQHNLHGTGTFKSVNKAQCWFTTDTLNSHSLRINLKTWARKFTIIQPVFVSNKTEQERCFF